MDFTKFGQASYATSTQATYDMGLRDYMVAVYKYMALALVLTGLVAYTVSTSEAMMHFIFGTPFMWVVMLAPLGIAFFLGSSFHKLSVQAVQLTFWIYAATIGLSLASIFIMYTGVSIARVFFISASVFGAMSLYGYTTKRDLTEFGSFLIMGLIGIVIASLVNIFLKSSMIHFVISIIGVFVFIGLTAFDSQRIKNTYYMVSGYGSDVESKAAIYGALSLYMDFINLFIMMLQLFGDRRQ